MSITKKKIFARLLLIVAMALAINPAEVFASDEDIAKDMATLFRSARGVISKNQKHINNPDIGDKGLSGSAVLATAKENFKKATGRDVDETSEYMQGMTKAVVSVMDTNQNWINEKGKGFKGFLPAIFAALVARETGKNLAGKADIKLTAPKAFVRNRANRPDKWEANVIETMFKSDGWAKDKTYSEITTKKGKSAFRFILPEYYKQSCLGCHGQPKGELDITGGKKEGGVLGQLGGAISVTIYK